jgi:hypothetical protein
MSSNKLAAAAALALTAWSGAVFAQGGDLSRQVEALEPLIFGSGDYGFGVSTERYELTTGQGYSLVVGSTGYHDEYAVVAPAFFRNVWLRKVEAANVEIKTPVLTELEFGGEGEVEVFFVPIVPGEYEIYAKGFEGRGNMAIISVK